MSEVAIYLNWLKSDEPSRAWQRAFDATLGTRQPALWMARHLRIDPADPRTWFALAGFAPMEIDGRWHIAAVIPAPDPFRDFTPGDDVVIVDPETKKAAVLGDPEPQILTPRIQPASMFIHTDPVAWLREWADDRVVFLERRRECVRRSRIVPRFSGEPPSALAIGNIDEISWGGIYAQTIRADFENYRAIKRAIFRAAHLPRVEAA